jgi:hypothetical protein
MEETDRDKRNANKCLFPILKARDHRSGLVVDMRIKTDPREIVSICSLD